jgi:membrane fusion protein (multidrug efflux system)
MGNILGKLSTLITILIFCASSLGCGRSESSAQPAEKSNQQRAVQVSVTKVTPVPMRDVLVLPGETEAWQDVRVASDIGGRVEWIGPKEGDSVKKGELLVKVDVSALKAALDRAKAAYSLADDMATRRNQLFDRKLIAKEDLDRFITELSLAQSNLRQAQVEYERGFTHAVLDGVVNHLFVDEGEFVDKGGPLMDLVNIDKIKINVNVPEMDVKYIKVGQEVRVGIDAFPERQNQGTVSFVAFKADPATKTFLVRILIQNPDHDIRPGMIARASFLRRIIPDALSAPLFALVDKSGERLLFVEKDGLVQARSVTIGIIDGDRVQITKGLKEGDHLIVTGQTEVEEGMRVTIK